MRFSLRTLIIVMLLGGPVLAGAWWIVRSSWLLAAIGLYFFASSVWLACATYAVQRQADDARRAAITRELRRRALEESSSPANPE